jgi:hypothetical protein
MKRTVVAISSFIIAPLAGRAFAAALVAIVLAPCSPVRAQEHLVDPATRDERLLAQANQSAEDLATLRRLLNSGPAAEGARAIGVDIRQVSSTVPLLSDSELRDLTVRAEALELDPPGGSAEGILTLFLVLLLLFGIYFFVFFAPNQ